MKLISDITIAVLIVNYHDDDNTINLIEQLLADSEKDTIRLDIKVLENERKESALSECFIGKKNVKFITSLDNLGYAGGMNYLIHHFKILSYPYALLLNPDIQITRQTILMLLSELRLAKGTGAISPRIISSQGTALFQPQFLDEKKVEFINIPSITTSPSGRYNGAVVLFDTKVFAKIGEFDENIFLYFDEWDYSLRMADFGIKIMYAGSVEVVHLVSKSVEDLSTISYYQTRNLLYLMKKRKVSLSNTYWYLTQHILRYLITLKLKRVYHSIKGIADFKKGKMGLMTQQ